MNFVFGNRSAFGDRECLASALEWLCQVGSDSRELAARGWRRDIG